MTKFSVGEKVWVKPLEEIKPIGNVYFPPLIKYFCNARYTVNCIDDHGCYILEENNNQVTYIEFAENWLESEEEHQMRVKGKEKEEKKEESKKMKFKDLKLGDMFKCSGSNIFTKTKFCMMEDDGRISHICPIAGKEANFVGFVRVFDDEEVTPINVDVLKYDNEDIDILATRALEHFGDTAQICQTMEECAELIVALNKSLRHVTDNEQVIRNVLEELADVTIMVEQMKQNFDENEEFDDILEEKMNKLRSYLEDQEAD